MRARTELATCLMLVASVLLDAACSSSPTTSSHPSRSLPPGAQAFSIQGEVLYPPHLLPVEQSKLESALAETKSRWDADPRNAETLIEYGRRLGALSRFREAIDVFTRGIAEHPGDARMFRFRGHRFISVREFDGAREDLERAVLLSADRADEPEPSLKPNARGVVIDTLELNIFYHLALAHYLLGEFDAAAENWRECLRLAKNDDARCMATYWLSMTLARGGREAEAQPSLAEIRPDLDVIEYVAYHKLCLVYKGALDPDALLASTPARGDTAIDFATLGYGIGTWHLAHGHRERALAIYRDVAHSEAWQAFGRIAAEVDLARLESAGG
jgi:tetratricopeptide (TPR) repeat protein